MDEFEDIILNWNKPVTKKSNTYVVANLLRSSQNHRHEEIKWVTEENRELLFNGYRLLDFYKIEKKLWKMGNYW